MPGSFFCKGTATSVWKSVAGVSAAGLKRGRGRGTGRAVVKDFNRGQEIGLGRKRLIMGGLNAPVVVGSKITHIEDAGRNNQFSEKITQARSAMNLYRKYRESPMDRGWSGRKAHGRQAGQPDEHDEVEFDGFNSTVLMLRSRLCMTGMLGRTKIMRALVVTGNGNGLAGFSSARGKDGKAVVRHARNRAAQMLVSIPRWDNHTVLHDFFSKYYHTTVFVQRKPKGYGLRCHRIIIAICKAFGITDLYAKVEGTTCEFSVTKAFFLGLMNQKKYQDIANEKRLHLVDVRPEYGNFPVVLASPTGLIRSESEIKASNENLDFTYYIYDGRIKQVRAKKKTKFEGDATWYRHLDKLDFMKNREKTKLLLAAKYGDTKVSDVFPYFISTADSFNKPKEEQS